MPPDKFAARILDFLNVQVLPFVMEDLVSHHGLGYRGSPDVVVGVACRCIIGGSVRNPQLDPTQ
jgi:hypothetical protein